MPPRMMRVQHVLGAKSYVFVMVLATNLFICLLLLVAWSPTLEKVDVRAWCLVCGREFESNKAGW